MLLFFYPFSGVISRFELKARRLTVGILKTGGSTKRFSVQLVCVARGDAGTLHSIRSRPGFLEESRVPPEGILPCRPRRRSHATVLSVRKRFADGDLANFLSCALLKVDNGKLLYMVVVFQLQ